MPVKKMDALIRSGQAVEEQTQSLPFPIVLQAEGVIIQPQDLD